MDAWIPAVFAGTLVLSGATTALLAAGAWRVRETPGAVSFSALMVAVTVWTVGYLVGLVWAPGGRVLWERVQWLGIVFVPVCFLAFALDYLGYDDRLRPVVGAATVPAVATLALVWTNPSHGLIWRSQTVVPVGGLEPVVQEFGPAYWAFALFAYASLVAGSVLLVRLVVQSEYLYLDQSLSVLVGVAVPLVGNAVSVYGNPWVPGLDLTPYAFTVTGLALGNALFRYRLFDLVPATWHLGRETVVGTLEDAVVVVDTDRTVVYCNDEAADVFDVAVADAVGRDVSALVAAESVDFDAPDALGELELDGRVFEVRTSEVADRHDRLLGYVLVFNDITERKRRERALQRQRDELRFLDRLNGVIRDVNGALIGTDTREAIADAVSDRLTDSELYDAAWTVDESLVDAAQLPAADSVRVDGGTTVDGSLADGRDALSVYADGTGPPSVPDDVDAETGSSEGTWTTVPVVYGRTVFGALVLFTTREDAFGERELAVLDELGEAVGAAIHAANRDRVSVAETAVELEFASVEDVLAVASGAADCTLAVDGLAPAGDDSLVLYCRTDEAGADAVAALETEPPVETVRRVGDTLLECRLAGGSLAFPLYEYGAELASARATGGQCTAVARVPGDADVRTVVERVQADFPDAELRAKRTEGTDAAEHPTPGDLFDDLTDRQREVVETAYSAGYFEWPRDATAEEVADDLDISSPTLHNHLRKAQNALLGRLLADADDRPRE
jgi:PAS domain S-box-containing protein